MYASPSKVRSNQLAPGLSVLGKLVPLQLNMKGQTGTSV